MPQFSQLLQLLKNEKDSWSNTPNLLSLLRSADKNPDNLKTLEGVKALFGAVPGVGDAIAVNDAVDYAKKGQYGLSALAGVSALPAVPNLLGMFAGTIKNKGSLLKDLDFIKNVKKPEKVLTSHTVLMPREDQIRFMEDTKERLSNIGVKTWSPGLSLDDKGYQTWTNSVGGNSAYMATPYGTLRVSDHIRLANPEWHPRSADEVIDFVNRSKQHEDEIKLAKERIYQNIGITDNKNLNIKLLEDAAEAIGHKRGYAGELMKTIGLDGWLKK